MNIARLDLRFVTDEDADEVARTLRHAGQMLVTEHATSDDDINNVWTFIRVSTEDRS